MGGQPAPRVIDDLMFNPRNTWRFAQDLISKFWRRLMKEYLSTLGQMVWGETQHCSQWCGPEGRSWQPRRALAFGPNLRDFSLPWQEGQSRTRQNRRQRLCASDHKVVSVGVIKSTVGTEHSHVPGGGCFGEYLFININAVRWDGQTIENTACVLFFFQVFTY